MTSLGEESRTSVEWGGFIDFLTPLLDEYGAAPVFLRIRRPFWRRWDLRRNTVLPIQRVEVSQGTWELCLHVPGLLQENPVGEAGLSARDLHEELVRHAESAAHCRLVFSDEKILSKTGLAKLATRRGSEWSGASLSDLPEGAQYVARLDLPMDTVNVLISTEPKGVLFEMWR